MTRHRGWAGAAGLAIVIACALGHAPVDASGRAACLGSAAPGAAGRDEVDCTEDPLQVRRLAAMQAAIRALDLSGAAITFMGCRQTDFHVLDASPIATRRLYVIYYPVAIQDPQSQVAALTHELVHVFQSERAGGMRALVDGAEIRRIELEADFQTGVLFSNAEHVDDLMTFQGNLHLVGSFDHYSPDFHGTPQQRTDAFRFGVFLRFEDYGGDFGRTGAYFLRDIYGTL